jgi:DNA-binding NarL/FixJ family response regulator
MTPPYRWQPPPVTDRPRRVVLSARQADVLTGLCQGFTYRRIGRDMGLADVTVKNYVCRINAAIGSRDRSHAVALAVSGAVDITVLPYRARRAA